MHRHIGCIVHTGYALSENGEVGIINLLTVDQLLQLRNSLLIL